MAEKLYSTASVESVTSSTSVDLPNANNEAGASIISPSDAHSQEQEYEAQFFGFTPKSVSDSLYNMMLTFTRDCLQVTQECIQKEFENMVDEQHVHKCLMEHCWPRIAKVVDTAFDKLEVYLMTNILYIPNNVILPEDQAQTRQYTKIEEDLLDADIKELKQKITNAQYMNAHMRQELKDLEVLQKRCEMTVQFFNKLDRVCKDQGVSDIGESLAFLSKKAMRIMSLLKMVQKSNSKEAQVECMELGIEPTKADC